MFLTIEKFASSRHGNFAVLTALVATTLCLALGGAVDIAKAYNLKRSMQHAADAGALVGAQYLAKNPTGSPDAAINLFLNANLPAGAAAPSVRIAYDKATKVITVATTVKIGTSFLKLAQINELSIAATSSVAVQQEKHTDIHFLLDVSESMNIASTEADRVSLEYWTGVERTNPAPSPAMSRIGAPRPIRWRASTMSGSGSTI